MRQSTRLSEHARILNDDDVRLLIREDEGTNGRGKRAQLAQRRESLLGALLVLLAVRGQRLGARQAELLCRDMPTHGQEQVTARKAGVARAERRSDEPCGTEVGPGALKQRRQCPCIRWERHTPGAPRTAPRN